MSTARLNGVNLDFLSIRSVSTFESLSLVGYDNLWNDLRRNITILLTLYYYTSFNTRRSQGDLKRRPHFRDLTKGDMERLRHPEQQQGPPEQKP